MPRKFLWVTVPILSISLLLPSISFSSGKEIQKRYFTLHQAINRAMSFNRSIQNELDNLISTQLSVTTSRSEFYFKLNPAISTNFSTDSENNRGGGYGGGLTITKKLPFGTSFSLYPYIKRSSDDFNSGIDLLISQPLLKGLSKNYNLSGVYQSKFSLRTARRNLYLLRVNVVLSTISAVYNITRRHEVLELQQSSYKRLMGYVETAKVKQKKGFATALDVYRATIQLKQAETLLTSSRSQYLDAKDYLKIILTIPLENEIEVKAPLAYKFTKIDETQSISTALQKRVELEQVHDMISEYERKVSYSRHSLLPKMDLEFRYRSSGIDSHLLDSIKRNTGRVEMSVYSSGDISRVYEKAEYTRSKMALKNAYRVLSLEKDEVKREVKNAIRNLNRLEKNILIQKKQIHDAKGKMELSRIKFSHGMANNFDLIESEAQYREAETHYISSIIDYIEGKYQLKAVMGILLDEFGFKRHH